MAISTINPLGGGNFTSVQAWLNSLANTTLAEPQIAELVGETVENIVIPTITTSSAAYLEIRPAAGQKHTGKPGTGARIVNNETTLTGHTIRMTWRHIRLIDIEIHSVNASDAIYSSGYATGAEVVISNIILYNPLKTGIDPVLNLSSTALASVSITNSLIVGGSRLLELRASSSVTLDNNTLIGLNDQILVLAKSGTTARNNYAGKASGSAACWYSETPHVLGSNNASSDTTAETRFGAGSINSVLPSSAFVDPATNDYQLKAGSVLIDAGVTISGFTTDILGTTRPQGSGYDIGAFEYGSGASSTPIAFSGSVSNQTGTEGTAFSLNLSTYFSGTETPFAYSVQAGTLPAGLSLNSSTGVISGTPTTAGVSSGIVIRATDATPDAADTNSFSITINAANTSPSFTGPNIDNISGTEGVALTPVDVSAKFFDSESGLTFSTVGSWPAGVTVSSVGVISGTPTTAGTYASLQVRATDAGSLTADSNAFAITVAAPAVAGISVTEPLKNNTGTVLASQSGVRVAVLQAADLMSVYETTGLTTNASGILATISNAAITAGQQYHVTIKLADGSVGITGPITAS